MNWRVVGCVLRERGWVILVILPLLLMLQNIKLLDAQEVAPTAPIGNVANGIIIYQQRCANCHGPIGLGDGELAANLPNAVPPIGSPGYAQVALPTHMFDVITNGNVERGMPPFGESSSNPLTEQERWDLISAAFAFGSSAQPMMEAALSADATIKAQLAAVDWTNTTNGAVLASLSDLDFDAETNEALVDWGRMTHSAEYFLPTATVEGRVLNGTLNQPLESGDVSIVAFEGLARVEAFAVPVNADGSFEWTQPSMPADWFMRAEVNYEGLEYSSQFMRFDARNARNQTELTVYETTDADGGLRLDVLNTVIEVAPGALVVNQLYSFENVSREAYVGGVAYAVPDSAENVSVNSVLGNQFVPLDIGSDLRDPSPIYPEGNSHTVYLRYLMPYAGEATIEHMLGYDPQSVSLVLPEGVQVIGGDWQLLQEDEIDGQRFSNYTSQQSGQFSATLRGNTDFAVDPTSGERVLVRDEQLELYVGGIILAITAIAGMLLVLRWQKQTVVDPTALLNEIAQLDNAFASKQIKRKPYEQRRRELKQQVRDIWEG